MASRGSSHRGKAGRTPSGEDADVGMLCSLPLQRLVSIARQSGIADPSKCAATLQLLSASRAIRHCVQRRVNPLGLSEARFLTLVTLYVLDPMPSSPADLAHHANISRPAMTDMLDQMEGQGWVRRKRSAQDRRGIRVHMTRTGRHVALGAIRQFLHLATEISSDLRPAQQTQFISLCRNFQEHAEAATT